jgi:membrane associated rhomboid family serine protease
MQSTQSLLGSGEETLGPTVSSTPVPPWKSDNLYPEPPPSEEPTWGYALDKIPYSCTFEELRSHIAWDRSKRIKLVWTPQSPHMRPPEEVRELLPDVRHRDLLYTKEQLRNYIFIAAIWTVFAGFNATSSGARSGTPFIAYFILPLVLGILPAMQFAWTLLRLRTREFTWEDALNAGQHLRYQEWLRRHRAPMTLTFIGALLLVGLVQIFTTIQHVLERIFVDRSQGTWSAIDAAGLVKSAVWEGEVWRLFTATVMHGSIWHVVFNLVALYAFGKVVEVLVGRAYLPIIFFFSAFAGSVFSLLLIPATSIGSSGGIMGIIGFLGVLGYYNRAVLPPGFLKSILGTVATVALFGLVAFVLIDNAAHAGGALCGALLGYLLLPHHTTTLPLKPNRLVNVLAVICALGIAASVLGSIIAMFTWR